jgi:hypothetical protein
LQQLLDRHHVGQVITERIEIVHAVGNDDPLLIFAVLEQLLHACMEIADVGSRFDHRLAVQHELQPQDAVR